VKIRTAPQRVGDAKKKKMMMTLTMMMMMMMRTAPDSIGM